MMMWICVLDGAISCEGSTEGRQIILIDGVEGLGATGISVDVMGPLGSRL